MIYMGSQESLAEICNENCDGIQKYGPRLIFFDQSLLHFERLLIACTIQSNPHRLFAANRQPYRAFKAMKTNAYFLKYNFFDQ